MTSYFLIYSLIVTGMLTGLIWTIQLVHYPAFLYIEEKHFKFFIIFHGKMISLIVAPLMIAELFLGFLSFYYSTDQWFLWINSVSILFLWLSTFFMMVPLHKNLATQKNDSLIKKLIKYNWPRTLIWTLRLIFLSIYCLKPLYSPF